MKIAAFALLLLAGCATPTAPPIHLTIQPARNANDDIAVRTARLSVCSDPRGGVSSRLIRSSGSNDSDVLAAMAAQNAAARLDLSQGCRPVEVSWQPRAS